MKCKLCGRDELQGETCPACGAKLAKDDAANEVKVAPTLFNTAVGNETDSAVDRAKRSMILLLAKVGDGYSKGTGFFVKRDRTLLCITNYHVVADAEAVVGIFPKKVDSSQEKFDLEILYLDEVNDVALLELKIDKLKMNPLPERRCLEMEKTTNIKVGDEVFTWGNPKHLESILTYGRISGMGGADDPLQQNNIGANKILVNIVVTNGNSGGALCNNNGKVIGMVTSLDERLPGQVMATTPFAIEQAIAMHFLKKSSKKEGN